MSALSVLVLESNPPDMVAAGRAAARSFYDTLPHVAEGVTLCVAAPYETPFDPGVLEGVDAVIFTGSGVDWCVADEQAAPLVRAMEAVFHAGLPVWGSCNGMQLAGHVLGGVSALAPKGREDGLARDVTLTEAGRSHPMMAGRPDVFAVPCVHQDEVRVLPQGATLLAGNAHSAVQAFAYETGGVDFWGTQYHPEFSAGFVADMLAARAGYEGGHEGGLDAVCEDLRQAETDPQAAARLGTTPQAQAVQARAVELRNWVAHVRGGPTAL